jgi:hypothetical protein
VPVIVITHRQCRGAGQAVVHDQDRVWFGSERPGLTFAESELGGRHDLWRSHLEPLGSRDGRRARCIRTTSHLRPHGWRNKDATEQLVQEVEVPDAGEDDERTRVADNDIIDLRGHAGADQC